MDEYLDEIGFKVNGEEYWEIDEINEVEFDELFRLYRLFVPYDLALAGEELEIEAISSNPDSVLMFKPNKRNLKVEKRELHKNIGLNFKVIEGIYVKGQTIPPVEGAQVSI